MAPPMEELQEEALVRGLSERAQERVQENLLEKRRKLVRLVRLKLPKPRLEME